ncbi:MAG: cbb3-type cytochrome c oxidase subunit I [Thermoleophilia bacterium]
MGDKPGVVNQQDGQRTDQEQQGYVKRRFGSALESVTGISEQVFEHEDRGAKVWLFSSVFWFIVVTTFGLICATELVAPQTFNGISWLVFSRVRPCHVEGVIYAWLTTMYFGAIFYFTPRLLGTRTLFSEKLAVGTAWFYNITLLTGFYAILTGATQGREYAEFPWIIDVAILIAFASNLVNILGTVRIRKVRPLYVSIWWAIAAPIWVSISIFVSNVMWRPGNIWGNPSGNLSIGVHDAMINWWGNHNLFGLWLTPVLIAVIYYFIPRITNTPLYSHSLSLISFWGMVFIYTAVGHHHLLQSPTPGWLKTIATVNSIGILIPLFAFFANVFLTMRGQWNRFFTSLPMRYVITGFVFYILVNVQGTLQALQPFNRMVHFTYFTIAHAHLALLGSFTILGMGVIYYMLPHILNKPPYSRTLAEWQFWLVTGGFLLMFFSLTIAGFVQGQNWEIGVNEVMVLPQLRFWNILRAVAGGMIYASAWIQAVNIGLTYFTDTSKVVSRRSRRDSQSVVGEGALQQAPS